MKKTLLALAVAATATSAHAIEIFNQDNVTVNMAGDVEIFYIHDRAEKFDGVDNENDFKQAFGDANLAFDTRYQFNDQFQIGAFYEISALEEKNGYDLPGNVSAGDVFVGLYTADFGSIKVGSLATQLDDAGIGADYQFGISSYFDAAVDGGNEAIRYDYDNGSFYGGFGLMQDKHNDNKMGRDGGAYDVKLGYRVAGFDFTAIYADAELKANTPKADVNVIALEARYGAIENLNIELGYYMSEMKVEGVKDEEDTIAIAADYTMGNTTFAAGYSNTSFDGDASDINSWFLNAGYALLPNTSVYAEVGGLDEKGAKYDTGFAVGIAASF
ncbi:porin [Vibrio sp. ZSDE26]|uniref:Porin n=1 Tax=Vibrio amylolyticus TaxID=2847292 RepID=A0A9X1XL22_9VIBR|nr:porin [Vibrio amylolyticus]MCK6262840.1 porin [Vibrio amylolyticus]